ncbi:hypothetical protein [Paraburkholderia sp. BL10I2N1]|uniref:hypothetical protein n=1 Tax=Paraburkholderia sp. BL10I2N1 TaxID=1938796 RepID=UPI00105DCE76|nr:hypothetical protein [Paraburkholderia sp. BL10I2N1]TDN67132.1 hypothetical protein B0G77_0370 [Paraburkholderia sp. BL10I2N1]
MDTVTLTGNNNVLNAVLGVDASGHSVATLNAFDSIKGAANSTGNTLNIADSSTVAQVDVIPATLSNIQTVGLTTTDNAGSVGGPTVFDVSGLTNLTVQSAGNAGDDIKAATTTNVTDTASGGGGATISGGNAVTVKANGSISVTGAAGAVAVTDAGAGPNTITVQGGTTVSAAAGAVPTPLRRGFFMLSRNGPKGQAITT